VTSNIKGGIMVSFRFCKKCGKVLTLNHYPSAKFVSDKLDALEAKHSLNLCDSCIFEFATCKGNPKFGNCLGKDNVIECNKYFKKEGGLNEKNFGMAQGDIQKVKGAGNY